MLTVKGIDANRDMTLYGALLVSMGIKVVSRYLKPDEPTESLSRAEAEHLMGLGLEVRLISETGFPTAAGYFNPAKGVANGTGCAALAQTLGVPMDGSIVCFATVDYDAAEGDLPAILAYQTQFRAHLEDAGLLAGIYGSGLVCKAVMEAGLAHQSWLSMSRGYADTVGYDASGFWTGKQTGYVKIGSVGCDVDLWVAGAAGSWKAVA